MVIVDERSGEKHRYHTHLQYSAPAARFADTVNAAQRMCAETQTQYQTAVSQVVICNEQQFCKWLLTTNHTFCGDEHQFHTEYDLYHAALQLIVWRERHVETATV